MSHEDRKTNLTEVPSFPKIWHMGSKEAMNLLIGANLEVTEKVDGSQFGFGLNLDGTLMFRSKGVQMHPPAIPKMFKPAIDHVTLVQHKLVPGVIYYGETLATPRHNTLQYDRVPKNHIALFGIRNQAGEFMSEYSVLKDFADNIDVDTVPLLHKGPVSHPDDIKKFLDMESYLGREKIEGVVIKNYEQLAISAYSRECFAKYVREEFKERNGTTHPSKANKMEEFFNQFKSEARWNKAIQHLRERGELTDSPKDIGKIIVEVHKDLLTEEGSFIREVLYRMFVREIKGYSTHGLPEFYKQYLMSKQFEAVPS